MKTEPYLQHIAAAGRNLTSHFGEDAPIAELTPDRIQVYVRLRREGIITGHPVRTNAIQRELTILKGALHWAQGVYEQGRPLLAEHPLDGFKIPSERDPRRSVVEDATVAGLLAVADQVHPYLATLIVLARTTGRRLSAVLGLHWADINFSRGMIRWRPENDKLRKTWEVPAPPAALEALTQLRAIQAGVGQVPVFPHPRQKRHPGKPVDRHLAAYWLKQAYELSKLPKPEGSLWHSFRRLWATERKHLPVKDVAAAGGWNDVTTLLKCYQQPDEQTLRAVMEYQTPKSRVAKPRKVKA